MNLETCPKCGSARALAELRGACPRCGLALPRWATYAGAEISPHEVLDPAFAALRERWQDREAHDAFVALAQAQGGLDGAAARYRERLRERSGDEQAARALKQVVLLAAHAAQHAPKDSLTGMRALFWAASVVAALVVVGVGLFLWRFVILRGG